MLSPYFPEWIIPTLSPVFNLVSSKVPSAWRGLAVLILCVAVAGAVVALTPLTVADLLTQATILSGLVMVGYTVAKPIEGAPKAVAVASIALIVALGAAGAVMAQETAGPVQSVASGVMQIALGLLNGILGRFVKRIKG